MALSYPLASTSTAEASTSSSAGQEAPKSRAQSTRCLHLSNLESSIDEYLLLRLFRPHGKITKLDHVRHKTGPLRGKPRGFAFVEYETSSEALKAMQAMSDKIIRGKKLRINFANVSESDSGARRTREEVNKPTTLSLLKSKAQPGSTNDKIKALEAKLRKLQQQKDADAQAAQEREESASVEPDTQSQEKCSSSAPAQQ